MTRNLAEREANFDSLCQKLEANDSGTTEVNFTDDDNNCYPQITDARAVRLGRALRGNRVVTTLMFEINNMTLAGVGGMCHFISSNTTSLSHVWIILEDEEVDLIEVRAERIVAMVDRLLAAVAMNGKINVLRVMGPCTAHSLANCLTSLGASLHRLVFPVYGTSFSEATAEDDAEILASVIRSLSHLEDLDLRCDEVLFAMPFLNRLGGGDGPPLKLRRLGLDTMDIDTNMPEPLAQALHRTLVSARLLETFHFCNGLNENNPSEENIDIVLSSIQQHPSISTVYYSGSTDDGVARIIQLLLPNRNIKSLELHCNTLMGVCTIMEVLVAESHPLRQLNVSGNDFVREGYAEQLRRIGELLPQLKGLKELNLTHDPPGDLEVLDRPPATPIPHQLLRGFALNTSLHRVETNWPLSEDEHVERAIDFYTARNKFSPPLAGATTAKMLTIFREDVLGSQSYQQSELSVIFETLRFRDDWFDKIDGSPRRKKRRKEV